MALRRARGARSLLWNLRAGLGVSAPSYRKGTGSPFSQPNPHRFGVAMAMDRPPARRSPRLNAPAKLMARLDRLLAEVERPKG